MSMGYLTSGNEIVDAMGSINISGNIIPAIWYKTITKENGKPYLLAIVILADIVYWYRPSEVRDQGTGHILGWKKKFSEDILRQSYQYYADLFGESKKTVKTAMDKLEQLQVIRREFRTVSYGDGLVCNNVMYVELKPDMLYRLTFPEEIPAMNGENNSYADVSDVKRGGRLPTKSDTPMEILGGRGIPDGTQVSTKWDTGHDETDNTLSPEPDTGLSQNGETDSYTTANITDGESYHINQAASEAEKTIDAVEDVNAYIEIIKENIEYDHYIRRHSLRQPKPQIPHPKAIEVIAELLDKLPDIEVRGSLEKWQAAILASEIDQFSYDYDTYQYQDTVEDREAQVANITEDIRNGNTGYLNDFLNAVISEGVREGITDIFGQGVEIDDSEAVQTARRAKELLDKLAEYKPLAKIEELEEQNYNMIDNVLNNGAEKKEQEQTKGRISIKEKLAEKKAVIEQRDKAERTSPEKETEKKSQREM